MTLHSDEARRRQQEANAGLFVRVKAYCVLFNPEHTHHLVCVGRDPRDGTIVHRLLGGHVEFGEYAIDAAVREIEEEVGVEIPTPSLLAVVENIFEFHGMWGHEVIFVYHAELAHPLPIPPEGGHIDDDGVVVACVWRPLADDDECVLHPEGLSGQLRRLSLG